MEEKEKRYVVFIDKFGNMLKAIVIGEQNIDGVEFLQVQAKPFLHIGDDQIVNCIVQPRLVRDLTKEMFDIMDWCTEKKY